MATVKTVQVIPVSLPLREPYRIARALQERGEYVMFRLESGEGCWGIGEAAPGIDLALHDVMGKLLGLPVYKLLGGRFRTRVPLSGGPIGLQDRRSDRSVHCRRGRRGRAA